LQLFQYTKIFPMADPKKKNALTQLYDKVVDIFTGGSDKKPSVGDFTPLVMKGALDPKPQPAAKKSSKGKGPTETSLQLAKIGVTPTWVPTEEQPKKSDAPRPLGIRQQPFDLAYLNTNEQLAKFKYFDEAVRAGAKSGINPLILTGLSKQESSWNPKAISRSKSGEPIAYGLTQFKPDTFEQYFPGENGNIMDPEHSLMASAEYLKYLTKTQPNDIYALRAYNQGPGNQRRKPAGTGPHSHFYPYQVMDHAVDSGYLPGGGLSFVTPYKYIMPAEWIPLAEEDIRAKYPIPTPTPTKTSNKQSTKPAPKPVAKPKAKPKAKAAAKPKRPIA
jgi:hypothetical protein